MVSILIELSTENFQKNTSAPHSLRSLSSLRDEGGHNKLINNLTNNLTNELINNLINTLTNKLINNLPTKRNCAVLYCTTLYCTVLYRIVLYYTVLYCTVLYCTVPESNALVFQEP